MVLTFSIERVDPRLLRDPFGNNLEDAVPGLFINIPSLLVETRDKRAIAGIIGDIDSNQAARNDGLPLDLILQKLHLIQLLTIFLDALLQVKAMPLFRPLS